MTRREVAMIVRESEGLDGLDFARHILSRGVTLGEYERYVVGRKMRWVAFWVTLAMAAIVIEAILTGRATG